MKMHCPHCGVKGSVDDQFIGRKIRCPKCTETFWCRPDTETAVDGSEPLEAMPPSLAKSQDLQAVSDEDSLVESLPETADDSPEQVLGDENQHESPPPDRTADIAESLEETEERGAGDDLSKTPTKPERLSDAELDQLWAEANADDLLTEEVKAGEIEEDSKLSVEETAPPAFDDHHPSAESGNTAFETEEKSEFPALEEEKLPLSVGSMPEAEALTAVSSTAATDSGKSFASNVPPAALGRFPQGLKPRLDFSVGEVLNEAWQSTKGAKGSIWAAVGVMYLIMLILGLGLGFLQAAIGLTAESAAGVWAEIGVQSLVSALSTLFTAGLMYIGVRRAADKPISWKMVFDGVPMAVKLIIASILMTLLVISGFFLLILPGIYLGVGYTMTLPLMLNRKLEPWQAMEVSRKAIHKVWWKVFGLFFIMGLIYLVSSIPLGIGLIWTVPMSVILVGVVYRYLFGVQPKAD